MNPHDLLQHHGIAVNPFADEDAQTDPVFQGRQRQMTFHPQWDKVYGDPSAPATSIVFGEKGAGKTAMRLQIAAAIAGHNQHAGDQGRLFVIAYDDFNPLLDRFASRLSARTQRQPQKVLAEWKLWDHMDAILSLGVTRLVDAILTRTPRDDGDAAEATPAQLRRLDRLQRRDLLLLAACYDNSVSETFRTRWGRLQRRLRHVPWQHWLVKLIAVTTLAGIAAAVAYYRRWDLLRTAWPWLGVAAGFLPWIVLAASRFLPAWRTSRNLRCLRRDTWPLHSVLMRFTRREFDAQPLPAAPRTDDRYELLNKFQGVLRALGYGGVVVLVDRVDEPHLLAGSVENMKALVWSMLDNKFLKQPGLGLKMLLPAELAQYVQREDRDFLQRARLDKQNMIPSLEWTGQSLYDLAQARLTACAAGDAQPKLRDLFEDEVADARLIAAFAELRVPRHLFKFLFRLLTAHCQQYVGTQPAWRINATTFETQLALYRREQQATDRYLAG